MSEACEVARYGSNRCSVALGDVEILQGSQIGDSA